MRLKKLEADENRQKILQAATTLFKARGADNVSVQDLMKAAGFTHGGFYHHFSSKTELVSEVVAYAFDQALAHMNGDHPELSVDPTAIIDRIRYYPTKEHRDDPGAGCPTGSLPVDVTRQPFEAQQAFARGLERYLALMIAGASLSRHNSIAILATLVGGITLSRAVQIGDPSLSDEILEVIQKRVQHEMSDLQKRT